jgi:alpha-beta hydrolase superfamily lysophospholipase
VCGLQEGKEVNERHLDFEVDGKRIPAAFTAPVEPPDWCVVLISGSGPADIDGNYAEGGMWPGRTNVLRDMARHLAANGVACFRHGRTNLVTVDSTKAVAFKKFEHRVTVAAQACRIARELAGTGSRIAVAGHSEGSVVGSMLCVRRREVPVDAYISLSGPAYRFYDLMLHGAERRAVDGVMQLGPMRMSLELYRKAIDVARLGTPSNAELDALPFGFHKMDKESQEYLRGYDAVDNCAMIREVKCPTLVVQGGSDQSVWFENGEALVEARQGSSSPTGKAFFPELDHFYKAAGAAEMDGSVATAIADWLKTCQS